jgi:hypothetical protein
MFDHAVSAVFAPVPPPEIGKTGTTPKTVQKSPNPVFVNESKVFEWIGRVPDTIGVPWVSTIGNAPSPCTLSVGLAPFVTVVLKFSK